ncbi:type I-E CRISPR-associated protein Cas6/Cse3/CasE [Croceibacterium ferulae]|uniref:type I-E CRISPR-associated protein Cas6/Cse3/CasE n=1 Tax=Croceibacterium ferulae TaxID=1854641 RepID=UPI000EAC1399
MRELSLVRIGLSLPALAEFAAKHEAGDDDHGYALHLALRRRYGAAAPQPFWLRLNDPTQAHLLGYVTSAQQLIDAVALPSTDQMLERVFPEAPQCRMMPQGWVVGARYRFEIKVRPVVRFGTHARQRREASETAWQRRAGEIDAFVAARARSNGEPVSREGVYRDWLASRFDGKATIEQAYLAAAEHVRSRRSTHIQSSRRSVAGVEAVMRGTLSITDGTAFTDLLARGIGRHVAFGNGMLLLSPAR